MKLLLVFLLFNTIVYSQEMPDLSKETKKETLRKIAPELKMIRARSSFGVRGGRPRPIPPKPAEAKPVYQFSCWIKVVAQTPLGLFISESPRYRFEHGVVEKIQNEVEGPWRHYVAASTGMNGANRGLEVPSEMVPYALESNLKVTDYWDANEWTYQVLNFELIYKVVSSLNAPSVEKSKCKGFDHCAKYSKSRQLSYENQTFLQTFRLEVLNNIDRGVNPYFDIELHCVNGI